MASKQSQQDSRTQGDASDDRRASGFGTGTGSGKSGTRRGFAAMDPERQREIARKGGQSSHGARRGSRGPTLGR